MPDDRKKRRASRRNVAGFLLTLALHGAVLGAVRYAHSQESPPLEIPRDFVVARMVKLGTPREKFWLPRITEPPRPTAPPQVLKVADDPNAAKAPPEAPRPENPKIAKDLKRALDRARKWESLSEPEPEEGQLNGSIHGTATEATSGDAYATSIADAIRRNWSAPSGLVSDAELGRLVAQIRIRVGEDGSVTDSRVLRPSGNNYFDDSCMNAIQATRKVPPPPAAMRKLAARGFAIDFAGKDMK